MSLAREYIGATATLINEGTRGEKIVIQGRGEGNTIVRPRQHTHSYADSYAYAAGTHIRSGNIIECWPNISPLIIEQELRKNNKVAHFSWHHTNDVTAISLFIVIWIVAACVGLCII